MLRKEVNCAAQMDGDVQTDVYPDMVVCWKCPNLINQAINTGQSGGDWEANYSLFYIVFQVMNGHQYIKQ